MNNKERIMYLLHTAGWNIFSEPEFCVQKVKYHFSNNVEQIADYLIANGVIVLPCKVGDPVFIITKNGYIHTGKFRLDDLERFGKRVFLTRAEAEKALKGGVYNA